MATREKTKRRWEKVSTSRVMEMINAAKDGGDQISSIRRAANSIEKEFGGIERLVALWANQVKEMVTADGQGSVRSVNACKDIFRVWALLHEADAQVDFTGVEDHEQLQVMFSTEVFVEAITKENSLLLDIVERIPNFDPNIIIELAKRFDLQFVQPETIVDDKTYS